jgi:hypothetical protein
MKKLDHTTHLFILAVHLIIGLAILVTYFDIKQEINQLRSHDLPELEARILISH